jgi:hypothetical protein
MSQSGASIAVSRPQQIVWAVAVFILNFAVGICWILARYSLSEISRWDSSILSIIYGAALIGTALAFVLFRFVYLGRNWARFAILSLYLAGVPGVVESMSRAFQFQDAARKTYVVVMITLQIVTLALLFNAPANRWFRSVTTSESSVA